MPADNDDDSGSSSECSTHSEVRRAAKERMSSGTQIGYTNALSMIKNFVLNNSTFRHCISHGELVGPVPFDLGVAYLAHVRDAMLPWPLDARPPETRTELKHYSTAKVDSVINAIKYSFSKLSRPMPYAENKFYDDFRHAFKHTIARDKATGAYPSDSGTVSLTMSATLRLLEAAMKYVPTGKGAAESGVQQLWLFILLSIATCGRGERVSRVQLQFISWFADSLTVKIPTSKSDVAGAMSYEKMCSANPWNPSCCLMTALGVEFLCRDESSSFQFLFGGAGTASHYTITRLQTALARVLCIVGQDNLGAPLHRLTGHFLKKTGIAFLRSCHECLSHDSRELRADHKVGPYNLRSDQDAIAGRILAFLKPGSDIFSTAPPHFHSRIIDAIPWRDIVPGYDLYSDSTKTAVHACVASVVHNIDFLDKNMSSSHPYHGCLLRKSQKRWVNLLQPYVLGGRSGFKSVLEETGQSMMSNMAVDMRLLRQQSVAGGGAALDQAVAEISGMKRAVERLTHVVETCPAFAAEGSEYRCQNWTIGYLPSSFRFPAGLQVRDCWFRWHDKEKPLRVVEVKMLPSTLTAAERARQCVLRRKIKGVMQILQGNTPNKTVDLDPAFVWDACWTRCVAAFQIREPCSWVVTTFYDFLLKQPARVEEARNAPAISFAEASAAAATSAAKTAQSAALFGQAAAAYAPIRIGNVPPQAAVDTNAANAAPTQDYSSVVIGFGLQAARAPSPPALESAPLIGGSSSQIIDIEYGVKKGVRCLTCARLYADKSGYNKHLRVHDDCERAQSFRHVHVRKRSDPDEGVALASAEAFRNVQRRDNSD